jgi:phosphoribosylanthranilate isomerase
MRRLAIIMRVRIKICCISSIDEAAMAVGAGADAIGLVGQMPSGPGVLDDDLVREIAASVPPAVGTFLLTQAADADAIADHVRRCATNTVQIVNHIAPSEYPKLIRLLPDSIRRVQVIHVEGREALDLIDGYSPYIHAFLLDSGRPTAAVQELGGTGRVHDWTISRQFVERSPRPVFLAGGLNSGNIQEAFGTVAPYGVDLCSSIRIDGKLSKSLLTEFVSAVGKVPIRNLTGTAPTTVGTAAVMG